MSRRFPAVEVVWGDAFSGQGWEDVNDISHEPHPCVTVGFELRRTKDGITIASSVSLNASNARMFIPAGMILRRKVLSK